MKNQEKSNLYRVTIDIDPGVLRDLDAGQLNKEMRDFTGRIFDKTLNILIGDSDRICIDAKLTDEGYELHRIADGRRVRISLHKNPES